MTAIKNLIVYLRRRRRCSSVVRTALRWSASVRQLCVLVLSSILRRPFFSTTAAHPHTHTRDPVTIIERELKLNPKDSENYIIIFNTAGWIPYNNNNSTYTEFLLSVRGHETLLGFLGLGRLFHTLAHFGPLAVDFRLFCFLSLRRTREKQRLASKKKTDVGGGPIELTSSSAMVDGLLCAFRVDKNNLKSSIKYRC